MLIRRHFVLLFSAFVVLLSALVPVVLVKAVQADVAAIPPVVPSATRILILPTLDTTADRPEMQQEHIVTSDHRLAYEFLIRGFPVLAPDVALRAARTSDIDLTAPDERTRKNLKVLGQAAGATWVVALTVMNVEEARSGSFLSGGGRRAKAKVEIRIWDVSADAYITNKFYEDTKSTKRLFNSIGTTGLFRQAIDTTVQRSVQDILTPYPVIKHFQDQFQESDVVGGELAGGLTSSGVPAAGPVLAAGTPITVVLQAMLRSDVARDGDPVMFHAKEDVFTTDRTHTRIVAKDAVAMGRVIVAKERGYAGKAGTLQFTCDYVTSVSGNRIYLRRDKISQVGRSNQNGAIALAVLAGQAGLLLSGRDAKFDAGTPFTLYVDQEATLTPTPASVDAAAPPVAALPVGAVPPVPMTLFTLADGSQVVGRLVSFDGTNYVVTTATGTVSLGAGSVKAMNVLPSAPAAPVLPVSPSAASPASVVVLPASVAPVPVAAPPVPVVAPPVPVVLLPAPKQLAPSVAAPVVTPVPARAVTPIKSAAPAPAMAPAVPPAPAVALVPVAPAPAPKPAPRLPVISTFPQPVRLVLMDGTNYLGSVVAFDGVGYSLTLNNGGFLSVEAARVKTLELLPAGH